MTTLYSLDHGRGRPLHFNRQWYVLCIFLCHWMELPSTIFTLGTIIREDSGPDRKATSFNKICLRIKLHSETKSLAF